MAKFGEYAYRSIARITGAAVLAAALIAGIGITPAQAATTIQIGFRDNHSNGRFNRSDILRFAAANGYADGFERGLQDRRDRRRYNYRDQRYDRGLDGFDRRWSSNQRDYQQAYRKGFVKGYQDAFNGRNRDRAYYRDRDRWYRNGQYQYDDYYQNTYYNNERGDLSPNEVAERAARSGYQAGFERGQYDARQRNRANPQGHGAFQFGFDGFDPEWGSAATYQQYYRAYFIRGYEDGYNRRSNSWRFNRL